MAVHPVRADGHRHRPVGYLGNGKTRERRIECLPAKCQSVGSGYGHGNFPHHLVLACQKDVSDGEHPLNGQVPVLVGCRLLDQLFVSLVGIPVLGEVLEHLARLVLRES